VLVVVAFVLGVVGLVLYSARTESLRQDFRLISAVPTGYVADPHSTGSLSRDAAADSTVMPTDLLRPQLEAARYVAGESRGWRLDQRFIQVSAYRFASPQGAAAVVQQQLDYAAGLSPGPQVVGPVKDVPSAKTFFIAGEQDSDGQPLFVWGAWFTRGDVAYLVQVGGSQPTSTQLLVTLTKNQFDLVD